MLYIEKRTPPSAHQRAVAIIKSEPAWHSIHDGDTQAIRTQFDRLPKADIRDALLREQHYLCAYCMKRIQNEELHMNIEHWVPLSQSKELALDYKNFLGVCKGGADIEGPRKRILCCDARKGDSTSLTVNPLDRDMMQHIAYRKDGTVYCLPTVGPNVEFINHDLNEVLQLNGKKGIDTATCLIKGRRDAYEQVKRVLAKLAKQGRLTSAQINKRIQAIKSQNEYPEFAGVTLFFLERKRKQLASCGK